MEDNYAAFLVRTKRRPLDVDEAESRFPDETEIVIKNVAVSVNPIDNAIQEGYVANVTLPAILGADVAGEVVEVGSQVNRFSVGDRVMGHALRLATDDDRHAGFQNYTVLWSNMATPIPPNLSYEDAATMPLGISTAAAGLFLDGETSLGLEPPVAYPPARDEWVIIAGATGNVGSHGVRLASAAGYKVLASASTANFDLARKLGATDVVDYKDKDLDGTVARRLSGQRIAGAFDASGVGSSLLAMVKAVSKCEGNRVVTAVVDEIPAKDIPAGVKVRQILAIAIRETEVGKQVWEDFLPDAMETGKYYLPYPQAAVFGDGLDKLQAAMDEKAPAGKKTVVTL